MQYPTWIELSESALLKNIQYLRQAAGNAELLVAVKANAYGHGIIPISTALRRANIKILGVKSLAEVRQLKLSGDRGRIIILNILLPHEIEEALLWDAEIMVSSLEEVEYVAKATQNTKRHARVHIKVDTGMGRLGALPKNVAWIAKKLQEHGIVLQGVAMHCPVSDDIDISATRAQIAVFDNVVQNLRTMGYTHLEIHAENSAATMRQLYNQHTLVRVGIAAYGLYPSVAVQQEMSNVLTPVLAWYARIGLIKHLPQGSTIGYGQTCITRRDTILAILPIGYCDGYVRAYSGTARVLVHGQYASVLGRVSMNMTAIDITDTPQAQVNDVVTLLWQQHSFSVSADDLAWISGTINYEVVTRLDPDIPRILVV